MQCPEHRMKLRRSGKPPERFKASSLPIAAGGTLLAILFFACAGKPASSPSPGPAAVKPGAAPADPAPASAAATADDEQGGAGPQILTADLLKRQEVRADRIVANWAVVGSASIQAITINGQPVTFSPGDTVSVQKEFILKIAQTVVTIAAVDARGAKRELSYLIVNPGLPVREPEVVMAATKIAETKEEQQKQEAEINKAEDVIRAKYAEKDYSPWYLTGPLNQVYNREVRRGMYPVWMEARGELGSLQFRVVFRALPNDVLTHRAYWGLTAGQYNDLVDDMNARGYQQVFREVLTTARNDVWRVQAVWVLKVKR